ncbi:MAG: tRNA uridine-5-carboxymethylaminomethyl(34) synthesis GTPase MnmE [Verrucomicrobiota bacterium]|nr:tRNA uridine-5-carboxymethylaminomethyl(34) synthesis GTPase MnmE [Verrucomicrobiota bacterium]
MPAHDNDTIAAISTPAGEGAIALVRLSGPEAVEVADAIFRGRQLPSQFQSHVQHFGRVMDSEQLVDEVMLAVHRAPHSYTGEDLVEISCHGGVLVTARVLECCLRAGARAARAGEFSERAFLHGKMDLTQAEAVIDLIRARTDLALRAATEQLQGRLGAEMRAIRDALVDLLAHVEAAIDFPDEDLAPDEAESLQRRLDGIRERIGALLATVDRGRILREGVRVVIYGATNAGKSSLLNRLLGYERAIVSEIPGTTRDTIEEVINLRGIPLRLLDTAGLRASADPLERAGMERTERSLEAADLVLHVVDGSDAMPAEFVRREHAILLLNKCDLPEHADWAGVEGLRISCLTDAGLAGLDELILRQLGEQHLRAENAFAINVRQRDCLRRAMEACAAAAGLLAREDSPEFAAVDLHAALAAVVEVIGSESDDAILDAVFAQFCIGK